MIHAQVRSFFSRLPWLSCAALSPRARSHIPLRPSMPGSHFFSCSHLVRSCPPRHRWPSTQIKPCLAACRLMTGGFLMTSAAKTRLTRPGQVPLWNPFLPWGPGSSAHVLRDMSQTRDHEAAGCLKVCKPREHCCTQRATSFLCTLPGIRGCFSQMLQIPCQRSANAKR